MDFGYRSPKQGWDQGGLTSRAAVDEERSERRNRSVLSDVLLWLPNRILDATDIVRADIGAGIAGGAVVRVTRPLQAGVRFVAPASARIGFMGRRSPVMVESSSEFGIGPAFKGSKDRKVCVAEVGIGVDLLAGAYLGICADAIPDFLAGFAFFDPSDDDL